MGSSDPTLVHDHWNNPAKLPLQNNKIKIFLIWFDCSDNSVILKHVKDTCSSIIQEKARLSTSGRVERGRRGRVGRLSPRPHHRLPRGNRPSNGKVVPHLHNHYHGDRKSFWETINVVLGDLKKREKGLKCLKEDLVTQLEEWQRRQLCRKVRTNSSKVFF